MFCHICRVWALFILLFCHVIPHCQTHLIPNSLNTLIQWSSCLLFFNPISLIPILKIYRQQLQGFPSCPLLCHFPTEMIHQPPQTKMLEINLFYINKVCSIFSIDLSLFKSLGVTVFKALKKKKNHGIVVVLEALKQKLIFVQHGWHLDCELRCQLQYK